MGPKPQKPAAAPARSSRASGSRPGGDGGSKSWLSVIGGLLLLVGVLALVYKLFLEQLLRPRRCPRIDPKVRRWPMEQKPWIPWDKIKKMWSNILKAIRDALRDRICD
ncbi:hypothetical protein O3G_MSEX007580 [Manduca sexta]|uniref:Uncharacterized protein n=1 Tax=Manduca sexta TaxID=7130 RepID=A0A922CMB6_MANSE|nr:hypothetical protein O3G_MSEX007580 [Manduca sexta]